ncbi:DUF6216 family protein [Erwinia sp. HDF1-3R]|uniref:DUF6216 family protein n=1 Tax=Erwinia sp. HDF1-3R TaxID=3141543 RepID=UPI0031F4DB83
MQGNNNLEYYKYIAYFVAFILATIRVGGVHFILVFFIKLLRLDFINQNLKSLNNELYDIRLFRFFTGIKARTLSDVVFIQECINKNLISSISFMFSGFFGFAGSKKPNKYDKVAIGCLAIFCVCMGLVTGEAATEFKSGYAIYKFQNGQRFYINDVEILDFDSRKEIDCSAQQIKNNDYTLLCQHLQEEKKRKVVQNEVDLENKVILAYKLTTTFFILSFAILVIGFINFINSSAKLRKLKLQSIQTLRRTRI